MMKNNIYLTVILLLAGFHTSFAQVTIAPTNLFIDSNSRFGTYMVINGSNDSQEISIDFFFAYSKTDEEGIRSFVVDDSSAYSSFSISDQIRAFPQNFTLAPGQRQVVRLRVNAPNDLPDGTYWARIRTTSNPETPPLELQSSDVVSARVGITLEQVTGVFYKKGTLTTGIEVQEIRTNLSEDGRTLSVLTDLERTGNSPFLGSITTSMINSDGEEVRKAFISTSIYFNGIHRQDFEIDDLPRGNYILRVTFESQRNDVSSGDLVQMETVTETTTYNLR